MKLPTLILILITPILAVSAMSYTNGLIATAATTQIEFDTAYYKDSKAYPVTVHRFKLPHQQIATITNSESESIGCLFYLRWVVETNDTPNRPVMAHFQVWPETVTNTINSNYWIGNALIASNGWWCPREHIDTSEHVETSYISSNLVSYLVWRGRTNINYLESIPVTNIVHKWHFEKKQVYTQ